MNRLKQIEPLELGPVGYTIEAVILGNNRICLLQDAPFTVIDKKKAIALRDWLNRAIAEQGEKQCTG